MDVTTFSEARRRLIDALSSGAYGHAERGNIDTKNLLAIGAVSPEQVREVIVRCNGTHHEMSPHHTVGSVTVHVFRRDGWYIKAYFLDDNTVFISVHN